MRFDEKDNGRTVEVKLNDEFEISLAEVRTAGFRWLVKDSGKNSQLLREESTPNLKAVGGSGSHSFYFRATPTGASAVELQYGRSWEQASEPNRTFSLKVEVRS
jgi:predicted secreted protein